MLNYTVEVEMHLFRELLKKREKRNDSKLIWIQVDDCKLVGVIYFRLIPAFQLSRYTLLIKLKVSILLISFVNVWDKRHDNKHWAFSPALDSEQINSSTTKFFPVKIIILISFRVSSAASSLS